MNNWKYFNPKFEYEEIFKDFAWPWFGHKFFAYDLVSNVKPLKIVELGTHYGTSFWSFAQAVKDQNLTTELNAIDTWQGEKHAGFYGEEVYETVNKIKDEFYSDLKVNLIRKSFDEALDDFENNSIDILHIDGLHTYDAVKHDFEMWLPKLKEDGIVLFHDIVVIRDDFGVYKFWRELREKYHTIEFKHSYGLGVLFKNTKSDFFKNEYELEIYYPFKLKELENKIIKNLLKSQDLLVVKEKEVGQKNEEIRRKNEEINFMMTSKFWKLRSFYLKLKAVFFPYKIKKKTANNFLISIKIPVPKDITQALKWGDYYFALALQKYIKKNGYDSKICHIEDWDKEDESIAKVVIRGLNRYKTNHKHINIMWNISHPDNVSIEEYEDFDHVYVASDLWLESLKNNTNLSDKISYLSQCTDPEIFKIPSEEDKEKYKTDVLFVGNSRRQFRTSVRYAIECGYDIDVFGGLWENIIDKKYIKGENISNDELYKYYGSTKVLLNDHWDDMASKGFVSNRIYDALACGAVILTDNVRGMDDKIKEFINIFHNKDDFNEKLGDILDNNEKYKLKAEKGRQYIMENYSFEIKAKEIIKSIDKLKINKNEEL